MRLDNASSCCLQFICLHCTRDPLRSDKSVNDGLRELLNADGDKFAYSGSETVIDDGAVTMHLPS